MKRCFCGKSSTFPLCDGSHEDLNWNCANQEQEDPGLLFLSPASLQNLALKAASHFNAKSMVNLREPLHARRVIYLTDGSDHEHFENIQRLVESSDRMILGVDENTPLSPRFSDWKPYQIGSSSIDPLIEIERILEGKAEISSQGFPYKNVFVSHSVQDESLLGPSLQYLRENFELNLFFCADSIGGGSPWFDRIEEQIRETDLFLLILSRSSLNSVFCAFESGMAFALKKPIRMISLDGTSPASYFQHLHMYDLLREKSNRPWLNQKESLLHILFMALKQESD